MVFFKELATIKTEKPKQLDSELLISRSQSFSTVDWRVLLVQVSSIKTNNPWGHLFGVHEPESCELESQELAGKIFMVTSRSRSRILNKLAIKDCFLVARLWE
jgi:hypothetical protein